jgi:hypothetical protein
MMIASRAALQMGVIMDLGGEAAPTGSLASVFSLVIIKGDALVT